MNRQRKIARQLQLLVLDVDGVLTDGRLYYGDQGEQLKVFSTLDGHGLKMLAAQGVQLAIISGRRSAMLQSRAQNLNISHLIMGREDKKQALGELLQQLNVEAEHTAYMGDDLPDLGAIAMVGLGAAPANAHNSVKQHADWISSQHGGHGAVRELCDFILDCKGLLQGIHDEYLDQP